MRKDHEFWKAEHKTTRKVTEKEHEQNLQKVLNQ